MIEMDEMDDLPVFLKILEPVSFRTKFPVDFGIRHLVGSFSAYLFLDLVESLHCCYYNLCLIECG
jgi:hypothetical protein